LRRTALFNNRRTACLSQFDSAFLIRDTGVTDRAIFVRQEQDDGSFRSAAGSKSSDDGTRSEVSPAHVIYSA